MTEEETRVAVRGEEAVEKESSDEQVIFATGPTLMFVKIGYLATAVGALMLVALTSVFLSAFVSIGLSVLLGLALFAIPAFYHVKNKMVSYRLTDSTLEIDKGFISRTTKSVPIRRIQDVTASATLFQRLLGFGDLTIDNASDDTEKIVLANINDPKGYAETILKQMRRLGA